jgi:hypothetical protein
LYESIRWLQRTHRQRQRLLEAYSLDLLLRLGQFPPQVRVIRRNLGCLPEVSGCQLEFAKQKVRIAAPVERLPDTDSLVELQTAAANLAVTQYSSPGSGAACIAGLP